MRKIRTALLSFGMSGKVFHAPFIDLHPGFELVGCWERSKNEFVKHYPHARRYDSLESLLADESIELVVVNTPTSTHFEFCRRALEADKHVVVEKAFTTNTEEAVTLMKIADLKNRRLSVFQNRRWDSDFLTFKHIIDQGIAGDIVEANLSYDRYAPALSPKLHKETAGPGAGIVKDLGPHIIDQALHLFGLPASLFASIRITREGSEVDDYFKIILFYDTFNVNLHGGYFFKEPVPSFVLHGKKGSFLKTRADRQESDLKDGLKPEGPEWGTEPEDQYGLLHYEQDGKSLKERVPSLRGNYMEYYQGIYEALTDNKPLPVTPQDGINVMKIIDAAFQSNDQRCVVKLSW